jgi:hypothetical protein
MGGNSKTQFEKIVCEGNSFENVFFLDKKNLLYHRMERWVHLQQFVYGLGDDFSYSVYASENGGICTCRTLVRIGDMSWFGEGSAADRQQALAQALIATSEAISANSYRVFCFSVSKWLTDFWPGLRKRPEQTVEEAAIRDEQLLVS